ncbi:hypothetical protein PVAND_008524 [Polypedilum vanderplanki]|uniref:Uncharacterized protein n=1 Tax=Polypedilum vanderplanki TaxID=319348 RepID=A0A9J6C9T3_POLVA|nr:hypothetical protein PVAND_008524 [Polypedilum vanderplanki]
MESTGDIMKGNWQKFFDISPRNELREELQAFLANRPEFDEKIKIGKSYLNDDENLSGGIVSSRYKDSDRYEMLTARHVFVKCETEELALKLERALQAVATEAGFSLIPGSDNYEGSLNGNARNRFIVYITCLKKNLFDCPVCAAVMTLDDMLKHRLEHEAVRTVINTNKLLGKLGLERLPEHLIQSREVNFIFIIKYF